MEPASRKVLAGAVNSARESSAMKAGLERSAILESGRSEPELDHSSAVRLSSVAGEVSKRTPTEPRVASWAAVKLWALVLLLTVATASWSCPALETSTG